MTSPGFYAFEGCPCASGTPYAACCLPLHDGEQAETAEQLMRSRYSAYAVGLLDHVFRTWHPRTRPSEISVTPDLTWLGLEVLGSVDGGPGDDRGEVEFRARFRASDGEHVLHERSRFQRRAGRWVYVDGKIDPTA